LAYRTDLPTAARRHLRAAQELHRTVAAGAQPGCKAVAGYLFGLAGELAVKQMMRSSGMRELPSEKRKDDPFYAHFPGLKSMLAAALSGRRAGDLRRIAEDPQLFQYWDTKMRYAPTADIQDGWVGAWRESAEALVSGMDAG
jgi:hypothetical protein